MFWNVSCHLQLEEIKNKKTTPWRCSSSSDLFANWVGLPSGVTQAQRCSQGCLLCVSNQLCVATEMEEGFGVSAPPCSLRAGTELNHRPGLDFTVRSKNVLSCQPADIYCGALLHFKMQYLCNRCDNQLKDAEFFKIISYQHMNAAHRKQSWLLINVKRVVILLYFICSFCTFFPLYFFVDYSKTLKWYTEIIFV